MEVYIEQKHWNTIINYARYAENTLKSEIGGMAVVIQDDDGDWEITHPMIMKQEVSGGTCDLDKSELAKYYSKMEIKYKKHNMRFCWWHSHAAMSAFWSGTDTSTIDEYKDGDLSFALVVNIKEEYKCRVSLWKPFVLHQDVELNILNKKELKIPKKIAREVAELCSKHTSSLVKSNNSQTRLWNNSFVKTNEDPMEKFIEATWESLIDKVEELNSELVLGNKQYQEYASIIQKLNDKLNASNIPLKVKLLSQNTMEEVIHITPYQLIECTDEQYACCDPSLLYGEGGIYG
jgi:hypothetical protein